MQKIGYSISSTESGILLQAGSVEILFTCGNMLAESRPLAVCLTVQQVSLMKSSLSDAVPDDSVLLLAALIEQLNQATRDHLLSVARRENPPFYEVLQRAVVFELAQLRQVPPFSLRQLFSRQSDWTLAQSSLLVSPPLFQQLLEPNISRRRAKEVVRQFKNLSTSDLSEVERNDRYIIRDAQVMLLCGDLVLSEKTRQ